MAVELSKSYENLVADAKLWLEGTKTVSLVLLVKLEESPAYLCPIKNLTSVELDELVFPNLAEIRTGAFTMSSSCGPAIYKGLQVVWMPVGRIFGFLESWGLDPLTKSATANSHTISHSLRNDLYNMRNNPNSGLWLSQLINIDDLNDENIWFDWNDFLDAMEGHIRETAANSCCRSIRDAGQSLRQRLPTFLSSKCCIAELAEREVGILYAIASPGWRFCRSG
ncbi:hypothetical protein B9Z19DRAFT_1125372 [Tuber borchii]|uniref:Uncharacterized protein n=1 Tax=Tuber borchii TaxID=42251 RepID=A0A2T6ZV57_TUBBO|nr:hypothetical protein B9Z19DRAFT_1125372 [Tuber borchii]